MFSEYFQHYFSKILEVQIFIILPVLFLTQGFAPMYLAPVPVRLPSPLQRYILGSERFQLVSGWLDGTPAVRLPASVSSTFQDRSWSIVDPAVIYSLPWPPRVVSTLAATTDCTSDFRLPSSPRVEQTTWSGHLVKLLEYRLNAGVACSAMKVALRRKPINKATHR